MQFLDSAAAVERVPSFVQVTKDASEDDFPVCAATPDRTVWCAYVAYKHATQIDREAVNQGKFDTLVTKGTGDQIRLLKFDGRQWSGVWDVTEAGLDVWRPAIAVDGQGGAQVIWSQNMQRVSTSAANDWHPALAANAAGDVWIAWDSYDQGNYDVMARLLARGKLSEPVAMAASPRFEARPSIAVDAQHRAWIAFEDADANWGKDYGTRWAGKSGVAFYITRTIKVRCLTSGAASSLVSELKALPVSHLCDRSRRQTK